MVESSPVVARWELSRRLAARRKELGVDVKTITDALGFTRNYWSAVENDRTLIAEDKLRLLFNVLDFEDRDRTELLQLREDSRKRGWWDEYPSLSDDHKRFYGMEAGAARVRAYDGHLIPGVLQIEAYTRAIIQADPAYSAVDVDRLTAVRKRRQLQILNPNGRPDYTVLMSEAALRQQLAGPGIQQAQLTHVIELCGRNSTKLDVRILPFDTNPGAIVGSSTLLLLDYESDHLPAIAYQEAVRSVGAVDSGSDQYRQLDLVWSDAVSRALGPEESRSAIADLAADL